MIARVATIEEGDPSRAGEVRDYILANIIPEMRGTPGAIRTMSLLDRANQKVLAISFWESEEDMLSAEAKFDELAKNLPDVGQRRSGVAVYEILLDEDLS